MDLAGFSMKSDPPEASYIWKIVSPRGVLIQRVLQAIWMNN